jgi:hypothetical protein
MIRRDTNPGAESVGLQPFAVEATVALIRPLRAIDGS